MVGTHRLLELVNSTPCYESDGATKEKNNAALCLMSLHHQIVLLAF